MPLFSPLKIKGTADRVHRADTMGSRGLGLNILNAAPTAHKRAVSPPGHVLNLSHCLTFLMRLT
jgi:hypothetical protein